MGKALLIIVLGFSTIFGGIMLNLSANHQRSAQAIVVQYEKWIARNASESVGNVAISRIYQNPGVPVTDTLTFGGATVTIATQDVTTDSSRHAKTDSLTIIATGDVETDTTVVRVIQPAFSYYYYFANQWPSSLTYSTGDTAKWVIHSNEEIEVSGSPVFWGKVSSFDSDGFSPSSATPKFYGGAEFGTANLWPPDLTAVIDTAQAIGYTSPNDLWLRFSNTNVDSFTADYGTNLGTMSLSATNGLIMTTSNADIHVRGIVNGEVTVIADGDIYIEGENAINTNLGYAGFDDYLGLIAQQDVIVKFRPDPVLGLSRTINIQAAIIAMNILRAEHTNAGLLPTLNLTIMGSLCVDTDQSFQSTPTGFGSNLSVNRSHNYDPRLRENTPPYFPRLTDRIEEIYRSN